MAEPRIAIVHHWLTSSGGAEKVLYELHKMYPSAPIYVTSYLPEKFPEFAHADIRTTFINRIPVLRRFHQFFPVFLGTPFKLINMDDYDIVISSCAAEAKYVKTKSHTLHICYCHTPVRYYWTDYEWRLQNLPFGNLNWLARVVFPLVVGILKKIDYAAAQSVDLFIANSEHIKKRIQQYYHRDSTVIYPPIVTEKLLSQKRTESDYYLIVGRQVASKRLDIAVEAFNALGLPLKVCGAGEEISRQQPKALANVAFLGRVSDDERDRLLLGAKAFIFPPEEDFGIVPLEAMAAGCPVIAFNSGGAPEYVIDGKTGILFAEQTAESLINAVKRFQTYTWETEVIRSKAEEFNVTIFTSRIAKFVDESYSKFLHDQQV
jgi:glycosyltransferase involved in cell wall biosynthesis